jgi:hypothetical protein
VDDEEAVEAREGHEGEEGVSKRTLVEHLRDWLIMRMVAEGVDFSTITSRETVRKDEAIVAARAVVRRVHGDEVRVYVARCFPDALDVAQGGTGRFLPAEVEFHGDKIRCALGQLGLIGDVHWIVDDTRVTLVTFGLDDDVAAVLRWVTT